MPLASGQFDRNSTLVQAALSMKNRRDPGGLKERERTAETKLIDVEMLLTRW